VLCTSCSARIEFGFLNEKRSAELKEFCCKQQSINVSLIFVSRFMVFLEKNKNKTLIMTLIELILRIIQDNCSFFQLLSSASFPSSRLSHSNLVSKSAIACRISG